MLHPRFVAELLRRSARAYAGAAAVRLAEANPEFAVCAHRELFPDVRSDLESRLLQIAEIVAVDAPELVTDLVGWMRIAHAHRGLADDYLRVGFEHLSAALLHELPEGARDLVERTLTAAVAACRTVPREVPSHVAAQTPHGDEARRFLLAVLEDRVEDAVAQIRRLLDLGMPIADVHDRILIDVQREVGRMWLMAEAPIADEHQCSLIVGRVLDLIQERLPRPRPGAPRVLAFSAGGNFHDLGIRVVGQRLQMAGFSVTNLGGNLPSSDLPFVMSDRRFDLIAVSVTMVSHLGEAAAVVESVRKLSPRHLPVLLGGRPFGVVPDLHARLGADGGAADADQAVFAAQNLVARPR